MKAKKSLALIIALAMTGSCATAAVYTIDSARILRESREGREILASNDRDKKALMDIEYKESQKIATMRTALEKGMQAGKLTNDMMQEQYEALTRAQRRAKHVLEDSREDQKVKEQRRVIAFRSKVHEVAAEFFGKDNTKDEGSVVFDKATPGMIFVAKSTDKTEDLLKVLNTRREKEKAQALLTKRKTTKKQA